MRPRLSAHRRDADARLHPLHVAEQRIAEVRAGALIALLAVGGVLLAADVFAIAVLMVRP